MNNKKLSIRVLFPLIMSISIVFCILSCMILFSHYISTYLVRKTIEETSRQKNVLAQNIENEIDSINSIMNNIYYNTIKKYDIQDKNFKTILANEITSNSETIYGLALYDTDGKNLWHSNNLTSTSMQNESWFTQAKDNIETICYGSKKLVYPDNVKQELTKSDLVPEEWGGDVLCVPVSALTGQGIEELLENLLLVADMKELKANPNRRAKGLVIEAKLDKGRGPVATLLVQNGTLNIGDIIIAGTAVGRVRAMTDDKGRSIKSAGPSVPV